MKASELRWWCSVLEKAEGVIRARLDALGDDPRVDSQTARDRQTARMVLDVLRHGAPVGIQGAGSILDALAYAGIELDSVPTVRLPLAMARRKLRELEKKEHAA